MGVTVVIILTLLPALALLPKARAGCSNAARPDPCGGPPARAVPTATCGKQIHHLTLNLEHWTLNARLLCATRSIPAKTIFAAPDRSKPRRWRRGGFRRSNSRAGFLCSTSHRRKRRGPKAYRRCHIYVLERAN